MIVRSCSLQNSSAILPLVVDTRCAPTLRFVVHHLGMTPLCLGRSLAFTEQNLFICQAAQTSDATHILITQNTHPLASDDRCKTAHKVRILSQRHKPDPA